MTITLGDLAKSLGAEAAGDLSFEISGANEPALAGPTEIAIAMADKFLGDLSKGQAQVALLAAGMDWQGLGLKGAILSSRPRYTLAPMSALLDQGQGFGMGIHPTAFVDPNATLAKDVSVGPMAVIMAGATIGQGSVIGPQCYIGQDATIGDNAYLREGVSIGARVTIGARFIAQPGARIGGDGFSFATAEENAVDRVRQTVGDQGEVSGQTWTRIHSLGAVTIGDDVEIGANACVDCGTIRDTRIGNGVKIDNLAQIGHNVTIDDHSLICAQVGIAGSSRIGKHVVLGGQTGVSDNIFIGDNAITGGATKVLSNVPAGRVMLGYPAMKMETHVQQYKSLRRLPKLLQDVAALQKAVFKKGESD